MLFFQCNQLTNSDVISVYNMNHEIVATYSHKED